MTYHTMPNMYHPESSDSTVCTEEPIGFLHEDGVSEGKKTFNPYDQLSLVLSFFVAIMSFGSNLCIC